MSLGFKEFIGSLVRKWWLIAILVLVFTFLGYSASTTTAPLYSTSLKLMYIDESVNPLPRMNLVLKGNKYYLEDFAPFVNETTEITRLGDDSGNKTKIELSKRTFTAGELMGMMSVVTDEDKTLTVTFRGGNAKDIYNIALLFMSKEGLDTLCDYVNGGYNDSLSFSNYFIEINEPELNFRRINSTGTTYTSVGTVIGLVISILVILIIDKLDIRIKSEEDLLDNYNITMLGVIPIFPDEEEKKNG